MLQFDSETLKLLDVSYRGADITRRRIKNMAALAPKPGDRVLDLGCGQGLMTQELARAVGPTGEVIGVDPSPDMRAAAEQRCGDLANVRILDGSAGLVPVEDGSLDGAISLQVLEYVEDIAGTLADLQQKLKTDGRLVVGDMHWGTFAWSSDDPDRMGRMQRAWEDHVAWRDLPARMPKLLHDAGFELIDVLPLTFTSVILRPDSQPFMMMHLMRAYAIQNRMLPAAEVEAWFAEQEQRAAQGRFFCSLTHFVTSARRR